MTAGFWDLPYSSRRQPVLADDVVATSQPLAVSAGLRILADGGNAVDAAIAAAAALTVVEPTSNGIGSDLFALVWDGTGLHGLNASGRSPLGLDAERFLGTDEMPLRGWDAVTVPGAVSGWVALAERFGSLPLERLVAPAAAHARDGFAVSPVTAAAWAVAAGGLGGQPGFDAFLPGGRAPATGERFAFPDQARTLELIAETRGEAFYRGELAERIARYAADAGAPLDAGDLDAHRADWVEPLRHPYGDVELCEIPPNGQGIAALSALGMLSSTAVHASSPDSADAVHLQAEAMKLAFADAHAHVADPAWMRTEAADLLADDYLRARAALIDPERAGDPGGGDPRPGGTVYLCTADRDGRMVSLIQSNYYGFGSGVVVPGTGISLQNRGAGFSTDPASPNAAAPGKRPFHTIIPGFVTTRDGAPLMAFGVMGGPMQPQGHVQMVLRTAAWGQNPQAAADAPRWRVDGGRRLAIEPGFGPGVAAELERRGHEVTADTDFGDFGGFGGAQLVARYGDGWLAASDPRKDGLAAGF